MKKYIFLALFSSILALVSAQTVTHVWKDNPADQDWTNINNWKDSGGSPVSAQPGANSIVEIRSGANQYPKLTVSVNAKKVTIKNGATLDLAGSLIMLSATETAKLENSGTLKLQGTATQKLWFEKTNDANKLILKDGCTVEYYTGSTDDVWIGPYQNLNILRGIKADSLTVEKTFTCGNASSPLLTVEALTQTYKGSVKINCQTTFKADTEAKFKDVDAMGKDITFNCLKLNISEVLKARNIQVTKNNCEWKTGIVEAENISIQGNYIKWNSNGKIEVQHDINANGVVWKAMSGYIEVKGNLSANSLESENGKVILNGSAAQTLVAKKIEILEVASSSNVSVLSQQLILTKSLKNEGSLNITDLKIEAMGDEVTIEGNDTPTKTTTITNLLFEGAGGKTLKFNKTVTVGQGTKLSGTAEDNLLTVSGEGKLHLLGSLTQKGKYLAVKTDIPAENALYETEKSKPIGAQDQIDAGKPSGWVFNDGLITTLKWKSGATSPNETKWEESENWAPRAVPAENNDVIIPNNVANYPILLQDEKAKTIIIEDAASLDLAGFLIKLSIADTSKLENSGILKLQGTVAQKTWFENDNDQNRIILKDDCTVEYYDNSVTDEVWAGTYQNLNILRNIKADSFVIEKTFTCGQVSSPALTVEAITQTYKGDANIKCNATFKASTEAKFKNIDAQDKDVTFDCKKVKVEELLKARDIRVAQNDCEWETKTIEAKNINVTVTNASWKNISGIVVEQNITANNTTNWKIEGSEVRVKGNISAEGLEVVDGKVLLNASVAQTLVAKKIETLEIASSSNVTASGQLILTKEIKNAGQLTVPDLQIEPKGEEVTIEGNNAPANTTITRFVFENADSKKLILKGNITVSNVLKLSGLSIAKPLTVEGVGKLYTSNPLSDKGRFLIVHTNIPIEGNAYITEKSKPEGTSQEIADGKPLNWVFDDCIGTLEWHGGVSTSWMERNNWRPVGLPSDDNDVIIPSGKARYPLLLITDTPRAKKIQIKEGAELDLATFIINTGTETCKVENEGTLKLVGKNAQRVWFESANEENRLILKDNCTVEYYGSSTDDVWSGDYQNLTLLRPVTATSVVVKKDLKIKNIASPPLTVTANTQTYEGNANIAVDVVFMGTGNIKFNTIDAEPFVLDFRGGSVTVQGLLKAKSVVATGDEFTTSGTVTISENFEGKAKKIKTQGALTAKNIIMYTSVEEWNCQSLMTANEVITTAAKKWVAGADVQAKNINIASTCEECTTSAMLKTIEDINVQGKLWKSNKVEAKNIRVSSTCNKWISSSDISVTENIVAPSTNWNATGGNITVKKDSETPLLLHLSGILKLDGSTRQVLKAKNLDVLEIDNSSTTDKVELNFNEGSSLIVKKGKTSLLKKTIIKKEFKNDGTGTFDATEHKAIVELKPQGTLTIKGKAKITNDGATTADTGTKFYKLHCKQAGGKSIKFEGAIEILYNISGEAGYVPPTHPNFSQDKQSLILEGSSEPSKLNILGNGQIWFNETPPYPKSKKGGKFLHVSKDVEIRGGSYRVAFSTHEDPTPRNWIFEEYAKIIASLSITGSNEVCVLFNKVVNRPPDTSLKITSPSFPDMISVSVSPYPKGSTAGASDKWIYKFNSIFTPDMILEKNAVLSMGHSSLDFIFEDESSDLYPHKNGHISDIGLNLLENIFAKNTKKITVFNGKEKLPFINLSLSVDTVSSVLPFKLHIAPMSGSKYWVPHGLASNWLSSMALSPSAVVLSLDFDTALSAGSTKVFTVPTSIPQFKGADGLEFMFSYDDLPCARLENANDICSYSLWKFSFLRTGFQRAGVSVFNNVINPSMSQVATVEVTTRGSGILTIHVLSIDGSIIKTLEDNYKSEGTYSYNWSGINEAGRYVSHGIYFIHVVGKGVDEMRKVLVVRN